TAIASCAVGIDAPPQPFVEELCPIDVRDRNHDDFEFHVLHVCFPRGSMVVRRAVVYQTFVSIRVSIPSSDGFGRSSLVCGGCMAPQLWSPLRTPIFRGLFVADLLSDLGTFMQAVGAAWLMVSLGASPVFVALTQTASSLPFFVFALPAGAIGDIVDRRK